IYEEEIILETKKEKVFFVKIDKEKIYEENEASGIIGAWEIEGDEDAEGTKLLTFESPDILTLIERKPGMESRSSGQWIFNKKDMSLLIMRRIGTLDGISKVIKIGADSLEFDNQGVHFILKRKKPGEIKVERLEFSEDEFYTEDGDFKYELDEEKLPWQNYYDMIKSLENVEQIIYTYSTLIEGTKIFDSRILKANVLADINEESLSIDYIFYGYDNDNLPEDTELPTANFNVSDYPSVLYPLTDMPFRISGGEKITTPAGTFDCTLIEGMYDFDTKRKCWMINDKPGIYAKIIEDKPGSFGHYCVYELQEIK
nr:hypothetical protein [Bacteroidales bacterium]